MLNNEKNKLELALHIPPIKVKLLPIIPIFELA